MGPLLGLWIEQGRLRADRPVAAILAHHLAHNRRRSARMATAANVVLERLAEQGVEAVVLKGAHTGQAYFPEPGARPASDIDLLVAGRDMLKAEAVLQGCGLACKGRGAWESAWVSPWARSEPRSLTYVHADDPWSIDLHSALKISVGPGAPLADFNLAQPMSGVGLWRGHARARVLEQPLLLLHLAAHAGAGWQNLTLLRQVELVLVIRQDLAAGRLSWDGFLDVGARIDALSYAYPALRLAEKLAPGTVPSDILEQCADRAPASVRRAVERLTPSTAQRIDRASVGEHFMWASNWRDSLRMFASDIVPSGRSWPQLRRIYEDRIWRLIRGRVSQ